MHKASPLPSTEARIAPSSTTSLSSRLLASRELSVVAVLALLCLVMLLTPARHTFYSQRNMQNILQQVALLAIFAIGETIVIITGGIDLSLGSLIAFSGMLVAAIVTHQDDHMVLGVAIGLSIVLTLIASLTIGGGHASFLIRFVLTIRRVRAMVFVVLLVTLLVLRVQSTGAVIGLSILLTLIASLAIGGVHASLIHRVRLPAFVVTLVSLLVLRSQSFVLNHRQQIVLPQERFPLFDWLANGKFFADTSFAIPVPAVILLIVGVSAHIILTRTRMGRYLYSVGSNEQATMLSGVNVFQVKLFAYGASALLGGLAGILWAGYGGQGDPQAGVAYELDAVAASVVGGASLTGGQGSVLGTVVGACLLHTIFSSINLTLSDPSLWRGTVVGAVLLMAVLATAWQQRNKRS